jgi:hypothetical protein
MKLTGRVKRKNEVSENQSRFPILGKIKVGQKSDRGAPQSVDYFICDSKYASFFKAAYGEKPQTIQVIFVSDDTSESCNERWECRDSGGKLAGYGDGEDYYLYDPTSDRYVLVDTSSHEGKQLLKQAGKWEIILTIKFIVPAIRGVFGVFTYSTKGGKSSVPQIRDAFDMVKEQAGTVVNIPFDLTVKKVKSQKPNSKSLFPVVSLVPNLAPENMAILKTYLEQGKTVQELGAGVINDEKVQAQLGTRPE